MARGVGCAVMPAGFSFTAQRLKPSLSHGRTRAELKFTEGRGRHVFCFAAGYEGCASTGQRRSCYDPSCCWCCALLARRRSQLWSLALGGAVCMCTPSPDESHFPSGSPNLGVQLQRKGSHDENLLVGASPVVDYFAFVLENLANSSGEPPRRCVLRPGDSAQMQSES